MKDKVQLDAKTKVEDKLKTPQQVNDHPERVGYSANIYIFNPTPTAPTTPSVPEPRNYSFGNGLV